MTGRSIRGEGSDCMASCEVTFCHPSLPSCLCLLSVSRHFAGGVGWEVGGGGTAEVAVGVGMGGAGGGGGRGIIKSVTCPEHLLLRGGWRGQKEPRTLVSVSGRWRPFS